MKKNFTLGLIFFTLLCVVRVEAIQPKWGFVDSATLINMHPLMARFNPETGRFDDTISQPVGSEDSSAFMQRLSQKLQAMETTIQELDKNYASQITGNRTAARKSYALYWKKRESLRFYAQLLRESLALASKQGNFYLGMPSDWTMMPVVRGICSTIYEVCLHLQKKHDLQGIVDISVFKSPTNNGAGLGTFNQHWWFWSGDEKAISQLAPISEQMMFSIRANFPAYSNRPIVAGAIDLRSSAMDMLRNISVPDSRIPGSTD